jgi:glycosyltransferase involved in cell wall biosynthesis
MKVLLICYDIKPMSGGESAVAWNIAEQLSADHEVTVLTRPNNIKICERYCVNKKLHISFIGFDLNRTLLSLKNKMPGGIFMYSVLWQYFIVKEYRKRKFIYDIVHSVNFVSDTIPSFIYKLDCFTVWGPISHHEPLPRYMGPTMHYIRSAIKFFFRSILWKLFSIQKKIQKFDLVLYSNESVTFRLGLFENMKKWSSTGVQRVQSSHKDNRQEEIITITYASRMIDIKGWLFLCDVINKVSKDTNGKKIKFILIGDGPLKKLISDRLRHDIKNELLSIEMYGQIEHSEFQLILQNSDIYICPSFEGGGIAVAEAMQYGLPIICFDNFGPGETVGPNYIGVVKQAATKEANLTAFYDRLILMICDDELRYIAQEQSLKRVDDELNWETKVKQLNQFYSGMI